MELTLNQALQKGIEAHKAGQVEKADQLYTAILQAQPKHPDANHNMGLLATGVGKVTEALTFFKTALEASPGTAQFWLSYIDALIRLERLEDAKSVLDQATKKGGKGDHFDKLKRQLESIEPTVLRALENQDPPKDQLQSLMNYYHQGQFRQALDKVSQLLKEFPNSVVLYNLSGVASAGLGKLNIAIEAYNQAISLKPAYADAFYNMGIAFQGQGKLKEATEAYKRAVDIKPNYVMAHNNLGNVLQEQEKLEEAIKAYHTAISLKPDYVDVYYNLGNALKEQGKLEEAIAAYNKTLVIKPDYTDAYSNMSTVLKEQGKLDEAIEACSKALEIQPGYADAYYNMGAVLQEQGKLDEAIEAFKKVLDIKPDSVDTYNNLGNALKDQGKLVGAIKSFNKAISIKPDYADAYNNMGITLQEQGKLEQAVEAYNQALIIKPDYAEAYNNKGTALNEQGKSAEAIQAYSKALAIKSNYTQASYNMALSFYGTRQHEKATIFFKKDNSSKSQTYLLKCFYETDEKFNFYNQLDYLISRGLNNAVIGSYISRSEIRYGINKANPFCNRPLEYVLKTDLTQKCDFKNVFVKGANDVLGSDRIENKSQNLLTNGFQTAGNVFNQPNTAIKKIENIIRTEVESYQDYFKASQEGLIKNWPSNYNIIGWLVSMKSGGKLAPHIHENGWISGSIYINVPPNLHNDSGNLVVCLDGSSENKNESEHSESIDVTTGSLCLFPASLLHYTIPFHSVDDRIVLAFDVVPK